MLLGKSSPNTSWEIKKKNSVLGLQHGLYAKKLISTLAKDRTECPGDYEKGVGHTAIVKCNKKRRDYGKGERKNFQRRRG